MNAALVAATAEGQEMEGSEVTGVAHAISTNALWPSQHWEPKAEVCGRALRQQFRKS